MARDIIYTCWRAMMKVSEAGAGAGIDRQVSLDERMVRWESACAVYAPQRAKRACSTPVYASTARFFRLRRWTGMSDMSVTICGVTIKNPVIAASGTFGYGMEYNEFYPISRLGGVSCKGTTLKERLGNHLHDCRDLRGDTEQRRLQTPVLTALFPPTCRG